MNESTDPHAVASALVARTATVAADGHVVRCGRGDGRPVHWLAGREVDRTLKTPAEAIADVVRAEWRGVRHRPGRRGPRIGERLRRQRSDFLLWRTAQSSASW